MGIVKTLPVSAQNTWSTKFQLQGDDGHLPGRRALVSIVQGTENSTVTLRRYGADGTTVISTQTFTASTNVVEIPVQGLYDVGVATGGFGTGAITITVEQ